MSLQIVVSRIRRRGRGHTVYRHAGGSSAINSPVVGSSGCWSTENTPLLERIDFRDLELHNARPCDPCGVPLCSCACLSTAEQMAKAAGLKYFGTAIDNPALNNQAYVKNCHGYRRVRADTAGHWQKWDSTERSQGQCYAWDMVNEALEDDGKYRQSPSRTKSRP
jgi:hypothetical protein